MALNPKKSTAEKGSTTLGGRSLNYANSTPKSTTSRQATGAKPPGGSMKKIQAPKSPLPGRKV